MWGGPSFLWSCLARPGEPDRRQKPIVCPTRRRAAIWDGPWFLWSCLARPGKLDRRQKPIVCPTRGRAAMWDRPSPCVVCRPLPCQERLSDDRNRSSVLPNRCRLRRIAGVVVHKQHSGNRTPGCHVGRTIAFCGHALPGQGSLTDDKNRSSVLPNRRRLRRSAGVVVEKAPGDVESATMALMKEALWSEC